jgi:hypothetical protein
MTITIQHPSITSPLFELAKTVEFNLEVAEDHFSLRIELFQDISNAQRFRARIWRLEMYRIQSTFPQNETDGQPTDQPSDESIFVDTGAWLSQRYEDFRAETPDRAIQIILNDLRDFLVRTSGGSEKILS